ncbi:SDR family oxidoreductase [Leucobacter sp. G161]|uniref:SDR family oxidoreductase n=1 Tax=Leucobacter sp. G161 TaxID=663704 RepID=UPI00073B56A0|nr:SDR family oxidoreductase [Leucobacter sp. G161]KUF07677.1 short-chain dehydrogenase [Leucobacter sp. G161]
MPQQQTNNAPTAVITGAGTGIGAAVARELSRNGWQLALIGRNHATLEATRNSLHAPDLALTSPADITQADEVTAAFAAVLDRFGRIDLLFNNAGIPGPTGRIDEITVADWEDTLRVNLTGTFLCAAAAFSAMSTQVPQGGRIINNGSIAARTPRPHAAAYAVAKHGIAGLSKSIALDGRALGITCTQLDIGNAATELLTGFGSDAGSLQPDGSRLREPSFPPEHVARMVAGIAALDPRTAVPELVITAAGMPYDGRG